MVETLKNADVVLFLRVFSFSTKKRLKKIIQNRLFLQSDISRARCYFYSHKSCFSKVIKPKAVNARINPSATIAVF